MVTLLGPGCIDPQSLETGATIIRLQLIVNRMGLLSTRRFFLFLYGKFSILAKGSELGMKMKFASWAAAMVLGFAAPALALDPALLLTQYGHTAWRIRDGYFSGPPTAITQTKDGYLWIGTESGLIRFDGVRFEHWQPPEGMHLPDERIFGLLGASDGSLWIGTDSGLARWKDGMLTVYASVGRFGALLQARNGTIWAGHTRALAAFPPLCQFAEGQFRCFGKSQGFSPRWVAALHEDAEGNLWAGGEGGICKWSSAKTECLEIKATEKAGDKFGVTALSSDPNGVLWAGVGPTGIWQYISGSWKRSASSAAGINLESEAMLRDRHASLWIGSRQAGLVRITNVQTDKFTSTDGLSGDYVTAIYEDTEGDIWVATSSGLDRFRNVSVATFTKREGLIDDRVTAVTPARTGGVWVADEHALLQIKEKKIIPYIPSKGLPGEEPSSLFEDSRGRLWLGIDSGIAWLQDGRFHTLRMQDGTPLGVVRTIAEDPDGNIWISTTSPQHALLRVRNGTVVAANPIEAFGGHDILAIVADPSGGLWLGLNRSGLQRFKDGHSFPYPQSDALSRDTVRDLFFDSQGLWIATKTGLRVLEGDKLHSLTVRNGLPCDDIESVIKSDDASLWLKTTCGLIRVSALEWSNWLEHPESHVQVRLYDAFDGAQVGMSPFSPRAAKSSDGRLWFSAEISGIQVVDPENLRINSIAPPVQVTRMVANHNEYEASSRISLPALTKDVEIDYTALSLKIPEKVRFRYKLEGTDNDWQDAGTRRQAFYTNLRPGLYIFRLAACNNDGVWSDSAASMRFSISPSFYQTIWFRIVCVFSMAGLLWLLYWIRLRRVAAIYKARMDERLEERERIARELHDTLLQSIQGLILRFHAVAKQIPRGEIAREMMEKALDRADETVSEGRERVRNLRDPADLLGNLTMAFRRVAEEFTQGSAVEFKEVVEGDPKELHPMVREETYAVGREALINAFNHSGGLQVEIELIYDKQYFRLRVRDDGRGFDPAILGSGQRTGHWGLQGMRERARKVGGQLEIWSGPGTGTEVELKVPSAVAYKMVRAKSGWFWFRRNSEEGW